MKLTFDEETHEYRLGDKIIPSVTQIISILSSIVYKDVDEDTLDMASKKGIAIHKAIQEYEVFGEYELEPKWQGYMNQYFKAKEEIGFEVVKSEQKLNNHRFAGTIDCVGKLNGKNIIVDWKTTRTLHTKLVQPQLSAYCDLVEQSDMVNVDELYVLQLTKTKYVWKQIDYDMFMFERCYDIYNYMNDEGDDN